MHGFDTSVLLPLFNWCCPWFPSLRSSHRVCLCILHSEAATLNCPSAPRLWELAPPHRPLLAGRKGGVFLSRVRGSDRSGTVAALLLLWLAIRSISFQCQLLTWASKQKLGVCLNILFHSDEIKIVLSVRLDVFPHRISVAPTQYKLGRHLAKCCWRDIAMTDWGNAHLNKLSYSARFIHRVRGVWCSCFSESDRLA